jgi:hypothetical protein
MNALVVYEAAFDTRIALEDINSPILRFLVNIGGYAAPSIGKRLEKAGARLVASPEGFAVKGTEGPLKEGEVERAAEWARRCKGAAPGNPAVRAFDPNC